MGDEGRSQVSGGHAFVDESRARGLVLVALTVAPGLAAPLRRELRELLLPGQSHLHFTKERHGRRGQIAAVVAASGAGLLVYDATAMADEQEARGACLQALVEDLVEIGAHRLVVERDDSRVKSDQAALYRAVRAASARDTLRYEHMGKRSEPLLWAADAAAWCWTHRDWRERVRPMVRRLQRLR